MVKAAVIIPVAGTGSRFGGPVPKQYLPLLGQAVIVHTVRAFLSLDEISTGVLVAAESETDQIGKMLDGLPGFRDKFTIVAGGRERQDSVANGLNAISEESEIVLVHDGVRPNIPKQIIRNAIENAMQHGGCVVAVPVKDTIKKVTKGVVSATLDRSELWQIQTPQVFRTEILRNAHQRAREAGYYSTDEAALVEWAGGTVQVVMGSYGNIKITTPEDLAMVAALMQEGKNG